MQVKGGTALGIHLLQLGDPLFFATVILLFSLIQFFFLLLPLFCSWEARVLTQHSEVEIPKNY